MIKKLLITLSIILMLTPSVMALELTQVQTAELLAIPLGRAREVSQSVAYSIWYTGPNAATVGVSPTTGDIYFHENGVAVTTIPQLNTGALITFSASGNTVKEVVDLINFDSAGYWHAFIGPDSTGGTIVGATDFMTQLAQTAPGRTEGDPFEATFNMPFVDYISCGVRAKDGAANRISRVDYSGYGDNTATSLPEASGVVEIWSCDGLLYEKYYDMPYDQRDVSISTIEFDDPGIGADYGDALCVFMRHADLPAGNLLSEVAMPATGNVSIIYSVFETK